MPALKLYLDTKNKRLVDSATTSNTFVLPAFFQGDSINVELYPLEPTGTIATPQMQPVDWSSSAVTVAIANHTTGGVSIPGGPTGDAGGPTPIAQIVLSEITGTKFTGILNLNTTPAATFLGSLASRQTMIEIEAVHSDGSRITYLQELILFRAEVIETAGATPTPVTEYFSTAESNATFARKIGLPGETIILKSPDGTVGVVLSVDNDGNFETSPITFT